MSRRITIVVCDDVPELRKLARAVLEEEGEMEVVGEAADGREAIAVVERLKPDVAVLDLSMPELDGLEAIPLIYEASSNTEIVGAPLEDLRSAVRELASDAA